MMNRVALVTGGGRGIGSAIARKLAADGMDVALTYRRDAEAADETVSAIARTGGRAKAYCHSVDDAAEHGPTVSAVIDDFGGLDVVVHNAGIASRGQCVADTDPGEPAKLMATHVFGPFTLTQHVLPHLRERGLSTGRADMVFISSAGAQNPTTGGAPYMMAKAAMEVLAQTLAVEEMAANIRVNVVAPGVTATDMGDRLVHALHAVAKAADLDRESPFGRVARPEDVADVVAMILSSRGSYLTGQRINVDALTLTPGF